MKGLSVLIAIIMIAGFAGCKAGPGVQIIPDYTPIIAVAGQRVGVEIAKADPVSAESIKTLAQAVVDAEAVDLKTAVDALSAELLSFSETAEDPSLASDIKILLGIFQFQGELTDSAAKNIKAGAGGLVQGVGLAK